MCNKQQGLFTSNNKFSKLIVQIVTEKVSQNTPDNTYF